MGQARNAATSAGRPALRQRLSVRRHLPGARGRRGAGAALRRHRHDATPSRRNLAQRRRGRPRRAAARPRRWHTTAKLEVQANITPIFLPSRAPELNPVENVWQFLRSNWLSNLVFDTYDEIIDDACDAWRNLEADPERITSIGIECGRMSVTAHDSWYKLQPIGIARRKPDSTV